MTGCKQCSAPTPNRLCKQCQLAEREYADEIGDSDEDGDDDE